jgi:hypothetical protein
VERFATPVLAREGSFIRLEMFANSFLYCDGRNDGTPRLGFRNKYHVNLHLELETAESTMARPNKDE